MWQWKQEEECCLPIYSQFALPLWDDTMGNQTPLRGFGDFDLDELDFGDEVEKGVEEANEASRVKRRRVLNFFSDDDGATAVNEHLSSEAIANLSVNSKIANAVADEGGIGILSNLARSFCRTFLLERSIRIPNCTSLISSLIFGCSSLANLAAHGDSNSNNAAVGQESGALEALVQLTYSQNEGVSKEAAGALWNLSFDDRNLEAIALAGGVEALVTLVHSCSNASQGLQESAAGPLWSLSVSEVTR
ncbi:hypothetical protein ZIOFF_047933 [Zingiber officinale]|uniref:Uncharacterized protein n=1 Tax=Zingiber officinale TaxID=94328 RepID=A0A8J5KRL1_ZINOF|nr:hypothetical protein ZIOFF_047933 [Zingiber officinale]